MEFRNFLDKNWDSDEYCKLLALSARRKAEGEIVVEMAMGAQNISKMPVFHDHDTWKFLQQFPPAIWANAIYWLYNEALVKMMKSPRQYGEIPEGWDWTSKIELKDPNRPNDKTWIFESPDGKPSIYLGLTKLAHKLSDPAKTHRGMTEQDLPKQSRRYWAGNDGPAIGEIDPNQTDPNHPEHISNYKHGLHDFDFEDLAESTPKGVDERSDWEIQQRLKEKYRNMDINNPEVKAKIKEKRAAMKKVLKSSFAGFDVLQQTDATESLTNWVRANALPEKPFGEVPAAGSQVHDPLNPSKTYEVEHLNPSQARENINSRWPFHVGQNKTPLSIPAMKKTFDYKERNTKTGKVTTPPLESRTSYVPILNPVKSIPVVHLNGQQKEEMFKRRGGKGLESFGDQAGMLAHWDMLTPEQRDTVTKDSKSIFQIAQAHHNLDRDLQHRSDPRAGLKKITGGIHPNYKTQARGHLSIPPEQTDELIDKYKSRISGEVLNSEKDEQGKTKGQLDRMLESFKMYGKTHPGVIESLRNRADEIGEIITYNLLTWLDNPHYGIKDDDLGLLKGVPWEDYDEEDNKKNREDLVYGYLTSIAQIGSAGIPSRRIREKYGMPTTTSINNPVGDSGKSLEGEIGEGGKKGSGFNAPNDPVRSELYSGEGESIIRAGQKPHKMFNKFSIWLASNRHRILNKLPSEQAKQDLEKADKNIIAALQVGYELYDKYEKELNIEDPDEKQKKIMELVHMHLPTALKQHFGELPDPAHEALLTKIKNMGNIGAQKISSTKLDAKAKETYDKFLDELSKQGESKLPMFNINTNEFEETNSIFEIKKVKPNNPLLVITFIDNLYSAQFENLKRVALKEKGPALYDAIEAEHEMDKTTEVTKKEYEIALLKWNAEKTTQQQQQQPIPMPQPAAQPAAQPVAQPVAAKALLQSLPELFALAGKVANSEDVVRLGQAFFDKKAELMAQPGSGAKLEQAVDAMRARRKLSQHHSPQTPQEYHVFQQLPHLVQELEAAHEQ